MSEATLNLLLQSFTPLDPLVDTESAQPPHDCALMDSFTPLDPLVDTERLEAEERIVARISFHSPRSTRGY